MIARLRLICGTIFLTFLSTFLWAQTDNNLVKLADEMYGFGDKKDALAVYLQAVEINPNNIRANYMAGKCYLETINKDRSVSYLLKAYSLDKRIAPDILFKIGLGYQLGNKFDEAVKYYELFRQNLTPDNLKKLMSTKEIQVKLIDRRIDECKNGKELVAAPVAMKIENLGDAINSEFPDYAPAITADEKMMIFTSRRAGGTNKDKDVDNEFFEDVYFSTNEGGKWSVPKNMGDKINSNSHDASIAISADGKQLFVYKSDNGGDIFTSEQNPDKTWTSPKHLSNRINSSSYEPSMTLTYDGKTIFFSSNRKGGEGGLDIYKSVKGPDGKWGEPENLGTTVNTEYDEDSPSIDADGTTLYFSSRGHKGIGGYDIFKTTFDTTAKKWSKPENLGYPINSTDDDIYFVISSDGKHGYFASAKTDGYGDKDLYMIYLPSKEIESVSNKLGGQASSTAIDSLAQFAKLPKDSLGSEDMNTTKNEISTTKAKPEKNKAEILPTNLKGKIYDAANNNGLVATIQITSLDGKVLQTTQSSSDGIYALELSSAINQEVVMTVSKEGYLYSTLPIRLSKNKPGGVLMIREIGLKKVAVGLKLVLRNVYFDFAKASLKKESYPALNKLVSFMKQNPNVQVEIGGHTDDVGKNEDNKVLSQRRAESVLKYVSSKGIPSTRLTAMGYGEEQPIASNDDEIEGRELNRRTEFKIMGK